MEYKRFDNTIVLRMDRGEEVLETLREVALKENRFKRNDFLEFK